MKRLKGLIAVSSLFVFAAAGVVEAEMVTVYGPVYISKTKEHGSDKSKLTFTAPTPGAGIIVVKNGGDTGKESRVSSAKVELNGKDVVREKDFNKKVDTVQVNVDLLAENELEVEVESCKRCEIEVTVMGEPAVVLPTRVLPTR